jgi:hypothetical protein
MHAVNRAPHAGATACHTSAMRWCWPVILCGCGRIGFDAVPSCWGAWSSGAPVLSPPALLAELNSTVADGDPVLAADDRTLYYTRADLDQPRLFRATRPARGAPFANAEPVAELQLGSILQTKVSLSRDQRLIVLSSNYGDGLHLYQATRSDPTAPFGAPQLILPIAPATTDLDPDLHREGLTVYFDIAAGGTEDLVVARRPAVDVAFAERVPVVVLGTPAPGGADPAVSEDERVLLYTVLVGSGRIGLATRDDPGEPFTFEGFPLPDPGAGETNPALSADGCELFFTRAFASAQEMFVATVTPE